LIPFSHQAFLNVFAAYNEALWPAVVLLWLATLVVLMRWARGGERGGRVLSGLLSVHWGWSAIAYHWMFFRSINPAAALFAALFLVQAALFAGLAIAGRGVERARERSILGTLGILLVGYALLYPLLGLVLGLRYPRMPVFAVPCPTAVLTAGALLMGKDTPRFISVIPILWCAIGGSAAIWLGMRADAALLAAGALLVVQWVMGRGPGGILPRR
jgi:hypothetical protein